MSRLGRWVVERRRAWLAAWGLALAVLAPGLARLESDNSPEVFFLDGSAAVERYREFVERFGPDEGARLLVSGPGLWTPPGLDFLERLETDAATLSGVVAASGLAGHHAPFLPDYPDDVAGLLARARASELDRASGLLADGGRAASVLVETAALELPAARVLYAELAALGAAAPAGIEVALLGDRSLDLALDDSARAIWRLYFPLLVLLAALLLATMFRDLAGVAIPLLFVGVCEGVTLGAMGWAGVRLHLILAVLPPVVFAIALATAVHLVIRCRALESGGLAPVAATVATYGEKGRALLAAGVSTTVGFAALAVSPVAPVAALGAWAALALAIQLVAAFTLLPALLATFAAHRGALPERGLERRLERLGAAAARFASSRRALVLGVTALVAAAALAGMPRLRLESNALAYLPSGHAVRELHDRFERAGVGVTTVELRLDVSGPAASLATEGALARLATLAREVGARPPALAALSAGTLTEDLVDAQDLAALAPPEALRETALGLAAAEPRGRHALSRLLASDGRAARVTTFVRTVGYPELDPWLAAALGRAAALLPEATVEATGAFPLLLALQRHLLSTLALSLALTLPALLAVFLVVLGEARDLARALVPNLLPVALLFGGMGWLGVPLDIATVMVASVVLGLVVDDTLHTLAHHREEKAALGATAAIAAKLEQTAPAYLLTGAILAVGFGVCALSDFAPTARFGALAAATIAVAVVSDLLLVPALFAGAAPRRRGSRRL